MDKRSRTALNTLFLALFLLGMVMLGRQMLENSSGDTAYQEAVQIAVSEATVQTTLPPETTRPTQTTETEPPTPVYEWVPALPEEEDPHMESLKSIDLNALREVNEDVIGWILIPDTKINYPIMHGEDNEYYLNHTWDGVRSSVGSIFLEAQSSADMEDFNTIVYGHNIKSGAMFAGLRRYSSQSFYDAHPYVYVLTDAGVFRYEVFASYKAETDCLAFGVSFNQMATREKFIAEALERNVIETGVVPEANDRILTLVTCSGAGYSTRWAVQARLKMVEAEVKPEAG